MNETRDAMHLMACCKWVESASSGSLPAMAMAAMLSQSASNGNGCNAIAINISPDANFVVKALWRFPTLVADVDCYTLVHS